MRASHHFGSSPGAASSSSRSCPCCPTNRWYEPGFRDELSISSPTLGRLRSRWQGTARPVAACRLLAAFGCTPLSWNTSSTSRPAATRQSGISRCQRWARCVAGSLSPYSRGGWRSGCGRGFAAWWTAPALSGGRLLTILTARGINILRAKVKDFDKFVRLGDQGSRFDVRNGRNSSQTTPFWLRPH